MWALYMPMHILLLHKVYFKKNVAIFVMPFTLAKQVASPSISRSIA
jgi:hypothetical protein